ncbi:MAG: TNT domain-containing protein [Caldanaerobacter sp.]
MKVVKPFEALEGKTASWFNQPGGGTQYKLPKRIKELINEGYIRRVEK